MDKIEMATQIGKTPKHKSVFQTFSDFLKDIWKQDDARPWDHYFKEQQFSYFWDTVKDDQK